MGAFEYTPPRGKKTRPGEQKEVDETTDSIVTPQIPTFATVAVPDTIHTAPNATNAATSTRASESASNRKRKRSDVGEKHRAPSYPKTHYPVSVTSPYTSPSLRRKYSTGTYSTPSRRRKAESRTSTETTPLRQELGESVNDDDTPSTPDFDLASPLLRTQLKAMTPNTPLSNRLVGANLDVGSVSQETRLQDYDDSFNAGEPTPKFELALLPAAFQVRFRLTSPSPFSLQCCG
ncbi:hypothetical protein BBJ28_00024809 [Nothophytophthora sp. Chile5]|nr:hypothetical protein BBJ28_00024809 [Nothophytophthora sp. Chile5]